MIPSKRYQQDVAAGLTAFDPEQQRVLAAFDRLHGELEPPGNGARSFPVLFPVLLPVLSPVFLPVLFPVLSPQAGGLSAKARRRGNQPRGIYLWGGVGRGKTCLMDLFFQCLATGRKTRTHFHRFMQSVHKDLARLQGRKNPLDTIADELADSTGVLCFDEFFVLDIGDAMILAGLLEALFRRGVVLVATSNVRPADLYENGLQRERFMPAIALIENNMEIIELGGVLDHRLDRLSRSTLYHCPADEAAEAALLDSFHALAPNRAGVVAGGVLNILDREIATRYQAGDVAWFDFPAICGGPRSAFDYVEIARLFHTLIISGVPRFDEAGEEQARRFVHLVDALYERRVKLILSAEAGVRDLYLGERLALEFERTVSRLLEMQSSDYLGKPRAV